LLSPIAGAVGRELVNGTYIQADETPACRFTMDEAKTIKLTYGNTAGPAAAWCSTSGSGADEKDRGDFWAGLMASCKATAAPLMKMWVPKIVHASCWAHSRREFIEALKLHPEDRVAARIVARIDELFSIDAEARLANLEAYLRGRWLELR
jgi:transposase IS66 family protein